jgi:integrase/recombinase XerD
MTVAEAIESFLFHCRYEKNLSPRTLVAYETDLRQLLTHVKGITDICTLGKTELRVWIQRLFEGYGDKTIKRKVATVKSLFNHLEREDIIATNPFRRMDVRIKESVRLPRTIPLSELERLFRYLYHARERHCALGDSVYPMLVRDIAVVEILFATGARVSEICHLRTEDVDLSEGWIRIMGKGSRERIIQLCGHEILLALRQYRNFRSIVRSGEPYFFLNRDARRLSEQSVRSALRRYAINAGLRIPVRPHLVRHSVATLLMDEGVDIRQIQHLLGHSSISTTQLYTHVNGRSQRDVLTAKHPRRRFVLK